VGFARIPFVLKASWDFWRSPLQVLKYPLSKRGQNFIDGLSLETLTWLSVVRIPVEICLYWLYLAEAVPELMTFEGRNFDILAGLTAPLIAYFGFRKKVIGPKTILVWNIVSLGLLLFIVANGVLSAPLPIQQFAFDQPNIALLNFPFSWLQTFIVPCVLFAHFVTIRRLLKK
jgi:hypothetical protein